MVELMTVDEGLSNPQKLPATQRRRWVCLFVGHALFGLGLAGTVLPVLPTTVFWIGAAACYARSSPERYRRLISNARSGPVISDLLEHGIIARRVKHLAWTGMALAALILVLLPLSTTTTLFGLAGITIGALYVLGRPERRLDWGDPQGR